MSLYPIDDHIIPMYDGLIPCYGATIGESLLEKYSRSNRESICPYHRTKKADFELMDTLPVSQSDQQLFCYTRFSFSLDELDRLAALRPWYIAADQEGLLTSFEHKFKHDWNDNVATISENEAQALLYRLKCNLFATAQRTDSYPPYLLLPPESPDLNLDVKEDWDRLAGYNDLPRVQAMRIKVSVAHARVHEVAQWITAVDERTARVSQYRQDAYWLGKVLCHLGVPESEQGNRMKE